MSDLRSLRICIASSGLGHVQRGIEAWAQELGVALAQLGHNVCLCKGAGDVRYDYERVIRCWTRDSNPTRQLLRLIPKPLSWRLGLSAGYGVEQTTFAWNLIWFLKRNQIDILHLQDPQVAILVQRAAQAGLIKTRTILNHGTEEPFEFLRKIDFLQHGAPWHVQSIVEAGIWKDSWTMIPNFVDTEKFRPGQNAGLRQQLDIPSGGLVALVCSAIKRKHKRVDFIIGEFENVLKRFPQLPVWLVIAGGRSHDTEALVNEAQLKLGDRVRFIIDAPQASMPELYQSADFLLHGSLKEMMPMALLEAIACGLPCLFHHHPVMQWIVGAGGMPLNLECDGELATAINLLATDHPLRNSLGQQAREHCVAHFDRQIVVNQILEHYRRVHQYASHSRSRAA